MANHTSNSQLKVDGKMTAEGANRVGTLQAVALIIFASAALIAALAGMVWAFK